MSFDPSQTASAPIANATTPKKSGAKKWIFGGLGCFGLLTLACVVGFYFAFQMLGSNPGYLEALATIESSPEVGEAAGNPVEVGTFTNVANISTENRPIGFAYDVPVSGPNGTGTAHIEVSQDPASNEWSVDKLEVEINGENVPLDGGGLEINIEGE